MKRKKKIELYEAYHEDRILQKRIIDSNNFTYRELLKILKPHVKDYRSVLDIGCGVGTIDFYLASKGKKVTGIDISAAAINAAKENAKLFKLSKTVNFIAIDFPNEVPRGKYDLVILSEVIEHLDDDVKALYVILKVLKPGGLLVITTPSKNAPLYRLGLLNKFEKSVGHLRRYTQEELVILLQRNGFEVLEVGRHEGILRNFLFTNSIAGQALRLIRWKISDLVAKVDYLTIPIFGESNLYIVAKKS